MCLKCVLFVLLPAWKLYEVQENVILHFVPMQLSSNFHNAVVSHENMRMNITSICL